MNSNSAKPSILIVHNHYQLPGGEDTVVENEKKLLEEKGHRVFLYIRNNTLPLFQKLLLPSVMFFNPRPGSISGRTSGKIILTLCMYTTRHT